MNEIQAAILEFIFSRYRTASQRSALPLTLEDFWKHEMKESLLQSVTWLDQAFEANSVDSSSQSSKEP